MAVQFNGSTDAYYATGGNIPVSVTNNMSLTMCCWVNFSSFAGTQNLMGGGFDGAITSYFFQLATPVATPQLQFGSFNSPTTFGNTPWNVSWGLNQWHHLLGTYNGAAWNLYGDGGLVAGPTTLSGPQAGGRTFTIGDVDANGTPSQFTAACMADAAVFIGVVSGAEITGLGNGTVRPHAGMSQTLAGYWPLNAGGITQLDSSGNGFTLSQLSSTPGTCGTSPSFSSSIPIVLGMPRRRTLRR